MAASRYTHSILQEQRHEYQCKQVQTATWAADAVLQRQPVTHVQHEAVVLGQLLVGGVHRRVAAEPAAASDVHVTRQDREAEASGQRQVLGSEGRGWVIGAGGEELIEQGIDDLK